MIEIKESHEIKSEIIPQVLSMALDYGRLESTLEAVERWYEYMMDKNKSYRSFSDDIETLGIILGSEFVPEEKPEAKAKANINISLEASNGSTESR